MHTCAIFVSVITIRIFVSRRFLHCNDIAATVNSILKNRQQRAGDSKTGKLRRAKHKKDGSSA